MSKTEIAGDSNWPRLLKEARNGSDKALGQICEEFRNYLLLAAQDGLNAELRQKIGASDVVQQAMLEGCNDFESFTGSSEQEFRRWIVRILKHNLIDTARRFRNSQCRDISREMPTALFGLNSNGSKTASSIACRQETDDELVGAIEMLSDRHRKVIELRHRQGLPYAEIALIMDSTAPAVRKLWERAVQSLQQHLASHDEQE